MAVYVYSNYVVGFEDLVKVLERIANAVESIERNEQELLTLMQIASPPPTPGKDFPPWGSGGTFM